MDSELKSYLDEQFKDVLTKRDLQNLVTKDDLLELATKNDLRALKDSIASVAEVLQRIDKRTDEDTKAVMKDVEDLNTRVVGIERLRRQTQS